ncbi:MAG TPA: glutamate-1-semialdehyde 2,1-aminomutase [Caldilineaceae bacterium]|nr:glutamate-1-semialdehyde 2,1-aminomutase [Caldilineaceae bacterium]
MDFSKSKAMQAKSHRLIPGGAHTYAKGDDQYPELAPGFIARGKGCHVWDVDGNEFIEYGMGLRSVTLGHGYEPVVEAAYRQMQLGSNFVRPAALELECAEMLLDQIAGAEMVKFAKNGSDVTTAAVKLARAFTGRVPTAICGDQPFFAVDDWFIGSTAMAAGIPQAVRDLTVKFRYNQLESVQQLFDRYPGQIACLVMEAETIEPPANQFLHEVKRLCHANGALFILDEIITGFRWHRGGAQKCYEIIPDLSTFGKAMGNGFSIAALVGRRDVMELGGLHHDKERVFLLSTTYGAETFCLAAAMETMRTYQQQPVIEHLYRQGERLRTGINEVIEENNLQEYVQLVGRPCNLVYITRDQEKQRSQAFRTLFLQEMIKRGLLMPSLIVSYAHTDADIDYTINAIAEALVVYRQALEEGVEHYLVGRPVKPVFRAFN